MNPTNFIIKAIKFTKNYVYRDPLFVLFYGFAYFQKDYKNSVDFYSETEFYEQFKVGKSVIRLGDGEISLMHGRGIHYQKYEKELKKDLVALFVNYSKSSPYTLALPTFVSVPNYELRKTEGKLVCWLPLKVEFRRRASKNLKYADAHFFYYKDKMISFFENFLTDKEVIFVTNRNDILNIKSSNKSGKKYFFVETPSSDAYSEKVRIKKDIDKLLVGSKNAVIVCSCGPLSKSLAYEYSTSGNTAYDIGFGLRYLWDEKDYSHVI